MASGAVRQLIQPCRGILAGSTSATTELATTLHSTIAHFASRWAGVKISLHVDDISLACAHKNEQLWQTICLMPTLSYMELWRPSFT